MKHEKHTSRTFVLETQLNIIMLFVMHLEISFSFLTLARRQCSKMEANLVTFFVYELYCERYGLRVLLLLKASAISKREFVGVAFELC